MRTDVQLTEANGFARVVAAYDKVKWAVEGVALVQGFAALATKIQSGPFRHVVQRAVSDTFGEIAGRCAYAFEPVFRLRLTAARGRFG